ncbi:ABC-type transport system, permease component [Desulforapulum autotrophicum HRM2]|uniref:ABC-type transport system, permease component n=1 Tax=Desulforapulum autotrophicum (strain ATCC 43914 / DSM 3382 / VKM B-1955 / HRM2) TaxID=177437 RepID=C0QHC3_DESAH|nr:iron ABC transporter permease [Desulforapulum autotrophicum]ACN17782.1 ABC-type transport system, permease component [Desulforapulum autotrophicum HRM2]
MHFDHGVVPGDYKRYTLGKSLFITLTLAALILTIMASISSGAVHIRFADVFKTLFTHQAIRQFDLIIWNIRLPQTLTAVVAGAGLAGAGTVMQSVLRNPLASPFTLGIAHAAAFGAAFSVMVLGSGTMASTLGDAVTISSPMLTLISAFTFSMGTACLISYIAKIRGSAPEVMVLTGVALGALFTAGTMLLQFFADDVELAAMVFWTFGDVARTDWHDLAFLSLVTGVVLVYFLANAWNYNAMDVGDETARGLGVRVERVRLTGMMAACLVTSVIISFAGIIGFIGLVAPHIVRRVIGDDHRFLMPASILAGALILLAADIAARLVLLPHVLPVSIFTSFLGAPVFIYLIMKGSRK